VPPKKKKEEEEKENKRQNSKIRSWNVYILYMVTRQHSEAKTLYHWL
jgi:hypothetical protein